MQSGKDKAAGARNTNGFPETKRAAFSQGNYSTKRRPAQGPRHGKVRGDCWTKRVRRSAHMLRVPPSWALDVADLAAAEAMGARWVCLLEQEQRVVYKATIGRVRSKGVLLDRGYGRQLALPLGHWLLEGEGEPAPEPAATQGVLL